MVYQLFLKIWGCELCPHWTLSTCTSQTNLYSKVGDVCRGWPEGSRFSSCYWRGALLHSLCYILTFDPAKNTIPRWCTGRRWHILMAVMRGNRVGRNWLTKRDEEKNSHGTLIDWCTGREWPVNCMTVISAGWRSIMPFQR